MSTGTEIINSSVAAATKTVKPVSLWANSLKLFVLTHPVGFFALTGGIVVAYGAYSYASLHLEKEKKASDQPPADEHELV